MTPAALRLAADVLDALVDRERYAAMSDALRVLADRREVTSTALVERGHNDRAARRALATVGDALDLTRVRGWRRADVWRLP